MKKLIAGSLLLIAQPFVAILGAVMVNYLNAYISSSFKEFVGILGGAIIMFNAIVAAVMVMAGHKDLKTFDKL